MSSPVLFDVVLKPNPPLARRGIFFVLGLVAALSFAASLAFVLRGAWPVTPFFGADVLLLAWALKASARAAKRREHLRLTHAAFLIERVAADGHEVREEINPYWLQVEHRDPELMGAELALVQRQRRWVIGSFLGAEDRAALAEALRAAFARMRRSYPA